jgi:predicted nuclease of restriction endonuclease-like RecB superfamily
MIKAGMIQVMEIILLSRMTILMNIYCFCRPCITNERNRQLWWETDNQIEHERNSQLRKEKYKRFWTNLFHRGVWKDPRYLEQKREALRRDFRRKKYIYHRCVIELVRHWYPNLQDKEYMGHMWE